MLYLFIAMSISSVKVIDDELLKKGKTFNQKNYDTGDLQ